MSPGIDPLDDLDDEMDPECVECGCTDFYACIDPKTGGPCAWVPAEDLPAGHGPLCTACLTPAKVAELQRFRERKDGNQ